jgi:hypothetical protein
MAISTATTPGQILTSAYVNNNINSGLVYVGSSTFTASSTVSIDSLFSSTYDNYRVELQWLQNTTTGTVYVKFRTGGADVSTAYGFRSGGNYRTGGTNFFAAYANQNDLSGVAGIQLGAAQSTTRGYACFDILSPNLAQQTNLMGQYMGASDATNTFLNLTIGGWQDSTTQMTGMSILASAGTMTGTVTVQGYRKA